MSLNSTAFLQYQENIATGTVVATGTYRRHKEITTRQAKNEWFDSLTDTDRERLKREYEEQFKNYYHD